jgi:putative membrane protein
MKQIGHSKWSAVIGVVALIGASNIAAAEQGAGKANNANTFFTHVAQDGEAEVQLGELAQQKAADMKVKDFGARMQKDHSAANAELRAIVAKKNLTIPGGPGPHAAMKAKLEKLEGATFDQVYMKAMVDDHTKAVREFEMATKSPDEDVKAFASKTLPTLREHLQMAQDIYKTVRSGMRSTSGAATPATKGTTGTAKPANPGAGRPANPGAGHPTPDTTQPGGKPRY